MQSTDRTEKIPYEAAAVGEQCNIQVPVFVRRAVVNAAGTSFKASVLPREKCCPEQG